MRLLGTERLYFHTPEAHTNQQYIPKHPQFVPNRAQIRAFEAIVLPFELRVIGFLRGAERSVGRGSEALTTALRRHGM